MSELIRIETDLGLEPGGARAWFSRIILVPDCENGDKLTVALPPETWERMGSPSMVRVSVEPSPPEVLQLPRPGQERP